MGDEDSAAILVAALQARSLTIIGLMTWWVAHQQKKMNRQQLEINGHRIKLDLYDRRWAVYEATERFMEQVIKQPVTGIRAFLTLQRPSLPVVDQRPEAPAGVCPFGRRGEHRGHGQPVACANQAAAQVQPW